MVHSGYASFHLNLSFIGLGGLGRRGHTKRMEIWRPRHPTQPTPHSLYALSVGVGRDGKGPLRSRPARPEKERRENGMAGMGGPLPPSSLPSHPHRERARRECRVRMVVPLGYFLPLDHFMRMTLSPIAARK